MLSKKTVFVGITILFACGFLWWQRQYSVMPQVGVRVVYFDIGQGDSIFITLPAGQQILIDGGPSSAVLAKLGQYMPLGDTTIDMVIPTHPDADHATGLIDVFERYSIATVAYHRWPPATLVARKLVDAIDQEGSKLIDADRDQQITFSDDCAMSLYGDNHATDLSTNDRSVVALLDCEQTRWLFTGDIATPIETTLAANHDVRADVLKLAHHGSRYSSDDAWLDAVHPLVAVVSAGVENRYGHPHPTVMQRLYGRAIKVLSTQQGDVRLVGYRGHVGMW